MNKRILKVVTSIVVLTGIIFVASTNGLQVLALNSNDKSETSTPIVQIAPKVHKPVVDEVKPAELTKFNGNTKEVKDFVAWCLKDSKTVPPDIKLQYVNATVGEPKLVKNLRTKHFEGQRADDYYILPLLGNNNIVGVCAVVIYDGQLTFGSISKYGIKNNTIFSRDINKIYDKSEKEKGIKVTGHRLVFKMDANTNLCTSILDPMIELNGIDGSKIYYSNRDKIIDKNTFDHLDEVSTNNSWH